MSIVLGTIQIIGGAWIQSIISSPMEVIFFHKKYLRRFHLTFGFLTWVSVKTLIAESYVSEENHMYIPAYDIEC